MGYRRPFRFAFLAAAMLCAGSAIAQGTYTVEGGQDLPGLAAKLKPAKATVNQMGVALVQANQKVIWQNYDRAKRRVRPGTVIQVPDEATVMKMDAATAQREFNRMWRAEQHWRAGLALEDSKDMFYALVTYTEAAKLGHGLAQQRLGQMYDRDLSGFVQHDLMESAQWYEKARANEVQVPGQKARDVGAVGVPTH